MSENENENDAQELQEVQQNSRPIIDRTFIDVLTDVEGEDIYIMGRLFIKGSSTIIQTPKMKVDKRYAEVAEVALKEVIQLLTPKFIEAVTK